MTHACPHMVDVLKVFAKIFVCLFRPALTLVPFIGKHTKTLKLSGGKGIFSEMPKDLGIMTTNIHDNKVLIDFTTTLMVLMILLSQNFRAGSLIC